MINCLAMMWVIAFSGLALLALLHFKVGPHVDRMVDKLIAPKKGPK